MINIKIINLQFTIDNLLEMIVTFLMYTFLRILALKQSNVLKTEIMKNINPQTYE